MRCVAFARVQSPTAHFRVNEWRRLRTAAGSDTHYTQSASMHTRRQTLKTHEGSRQIYLRVVRDHERLRGAKEKVKWSQHEHVRIDEAYSVVLDQAPRRKLVGGGYPRQEGGRGLQPHAKVSLEAHLHHPRDVDSTKQDDNVALTVARLDAPQRLRERLDEPETTVQLRRRESRALVSTEATV